jgi:hypothetical protein
MNLYLEQNPIGKQADGAPLLGLRIILNGADVVPTDEQRATCLAAIAALSPAPKEEAKAPAATASPKPSEK